jgi:hypothetical protein
VALCERLPGWGAVNAPGETLIRRQKLVAEPAGSQSEPDPGATNYPAVQTGGRTPLDPGDLL